MNYRIAAVEIHDYKRIRDVVIRPDADAVWVLLGGANAQGKTSVLDALEALLGGKDALISDPVRHGAERAEIRAKLQPDGDAPALTVRRVVDPDGSSKLELRDDMGAVKSPQAVLDRLVGARFIDPLSFLRLKAPEQRAKLLELIDKDGEIAKLDARRDRLFTRRTEVAREVKRTAGALASMPEVVIGEPIDVAALASEQRQLAEAIRTHDRTVVELSNRRRDLEASRVVVSDIEKQIAKLTAQLPVARETTSAYESQYNAAVSAEKTLAASTNPDRERAIHAEIRQAAQHNERVAAGRAARDQRAKLAGEHAHHQLEHDTLESQIYDIDRAKDDRLRDASLPVEGLGITKDGVTFKGAPLTSASGAERMCVAIAVAAAAQPQLRDVWIRDAAILDDDTMAEVARMAKETGIRPWLERVLTRDAGVIEIRDGRVVDVDTRAAEALGQGSLF